MKLVGYSAAIQGVHHLIQQVAKTQASVLILGESGTGKELVSRILHQHSPRSEGPFIPINCAAIPLELLESELFGHEKGSFTGAYQSRIGRFELAAGGTLFLDEIGDMPLIMQAKLLRVLQERSFERVGGNKSILADVRIIAATHKHLLDAIEKGTFREDLYYRLNVFPIEVPPLRKRSEDISLLIQYFIECYQARNPNAEPMALTRESLEYLQDYAWPGNVRELGNMVERLMILYAGKPVLLSELVEHCFQHLKNSRREDQYLKIFSAKESPGIEFDLKEHLAKLEYAYIVESLNEQQGIVSQAAKQLGLRRTTLVEKMKKYHIGRGILTEPLDRESGYSQN